MRMPPLPADSIHARACKLKCEKILTRPINVFKGRESVLQGVWGTPHQAKGGDSSESPPAVFWLQKALLTNFQSLSVSLIVKKTFHLTF